MLKLYTKNGCAPCQRVKDYLSGRPNLAVEVINCSDNPERVMEFSEFSKTFPTLVTDWAFVSDSNKIIETLETLSDEGTQATKTEDQQLHTDTVAYQPQPKSAPQNIDNKIARIPEPDCEACQ